jgi:hypothetical protein
MRGLLLVAVVHNNDGFRFTRMQPCVGVGVDVCGDAGRRVGVLAAPLAPYGGGGHNVRGTRRRCGRGRRRRRGLRLLHVRRGGRPCRRGRPHQLKELRTQRRARAGGGGGRWRWRARGSSTRGSSSCHARSLRAHGSLLPLAVPRVSKTRGPQHVTWTRPPPPHSPTHARRTCGCANSSKSAVGRCCTSRVSLKSCSKSVTARVVSCTTPPPGREASVRCSRPMRSANSSSGSPSSLHAETGPQRRSHTGEGGGRE